MFRLLERVTVAGEVFTLTAHLISFYIFDTWFYTSCVFLYHLSHIHEILVFVRSISNFYGYKKLWTCYRSMGKQLELILFFTVMQLLFSDLRIESCLMLSSHEFITLYINFFCEQSQYWKGCHIHIFKQLVGLICLKVPRGQWVFQSFHKKKWQVGLS